MEIRDTRNGEWHWVYNSLLSDPHLTPAEKSVYSAIATFSGYKDIRPNFDTISKRCSLGRRTVITAIQKLEKVGYLSIIKGGGKGNSNIYSLLKMPKGCKICTLSNSAKNDNQTVQITAPKGAKSAPHIDKVNRYKDIDIAKPVLQINPAIDLFKSINPNYEIFFRNKTQRSAVERLLKKYGTEKLARMIEVAGQVNGQEYAPTITTPVQLEQKLASLVIYYKKHVMPLHDPNKRILDDIKTTNS